MQKVAWRAPGAEAPALNLRAAQVISASAGTPRVALPGGLQKAVRRVPGAEVPEPNTQVAQVAIQWATQAAETQAERAVVRAQLKAAPVRVVRSQDMPAAPARMRARAEAVARAQQRAAEAARTIMDAVSTARMLVRCTLASRRSPVC